MINLIKKLTGKNARHNQSLTLEHLPMFNRNRVRVAFAAILTTLILSACGGGSEVDSGEILLSCNLPERPDATGTLCVAPPPIECTAPEVPNEEGDQCVVAADPTAPDPVAKPTANQAVLYYNRAARDADNSSNDPAYEGWRLHTWSNSDCDAYSDPDTAWEDGRVHDGVDPNYGAYWILDLKPGYAGTDGACGNFIIHKGTSGSAGVDDGKEMGGGDFKMPLSQDDPDFARMNFTFSGVANIYEFPIVSLGPQPVKIENAAAHWLDASTLVWDADSLVSQVKIHYSLAADIEVSLETGISGTALDMTESELTEAQTTRARYLAGMRAFTGEWTADDAKAVLKGQIVAAGYNADGELIEATAVQTPLVLDDVYTMGEADADEATLGPIYEGDNISAAVWAPTAQSVNLLIYGEDKRVAATHAMTEDPVTGVWSYTGGSELDRTLYRFEVTVYHPVTGKLEPLLTTDPYSVALSTNSRFSRFVNLDDEDLKPEGWDTHVIPSIQDPEDAVIYEGHIRDFSARDMSVSEENRGKYMAFTETDSVPVQHLKSLADSGMKYFHMLPANDIATIEEDEANSVDLDSTVQQLCNLNRFAEICQDGSVDRTQTLLQVFESYSVVSEAGAAQQLVEDMRNVDQYNWGYDPYHFNAPEGSYSSDPEGVARIIEMRAMNQALHELGLRVVVDVVYNHTNASGVNVRSVLDKVVPGYYHRYNLVTGEIERSTCCDNTATEHKMMEKLTVDSTVLWASQYKFDGFRFDLMGHMTRDSVLAARDAVRAVDPDNYFYGEGWDFGEVSGNQRFEQATQRGMAGTEVGTFNDQVRDPVQDGIFFFNQEGNVNPRQLEIQDRFKMGLAGSIAEFVFEDRTGNGTEASRLGAYGQDPADIINYVSVHDELTLFDRYQNTLPDTYTAAERVRAQLIGLSIPMFSQGIPFFHMGSDLLRSKSMDIDSFDSGDWFNYIDFTKSTNNWAVGLPRADKNFDEWTTIGEYFAQADRAAGMTDIEFAGEVFKEMLSIRDSSKLFRLTNAADISDRVGFHNIGEDQTNGLIVLSIDDGVGPDSENPFTDIDPAHDAVVVVVNGTQQEQSHTVRTASGFELHMVQMNSVDPAVRGASFSEAVVDEEVQGTFTVPAMTTAVFVIPQTGEQGAGLSALATAGAPDVVPYGATGVFLRGTPFDWANPAPPEAEFTYQGDGIYTVNIALTEGETPNFKIAKGDWDNADENLDLGATSDSENTLTLGEDLVLNANGGGNLSFTVPATTVYTFTLNAFDTSMPVLNIDYEEPYFGEPIFLRGTMFDWGNPAPDSAQLEYEGNGIYSVVIDLPARNGGDSHNFKVASRDWDNDLNVNLGGDEGDESVTLGEAHPIGGPNNLTFQTDEDDRFVFKLDASDLDNQEITVFKADIFGETTVYIRGSINDWAAVDEMTYDAATGFYSVEIDVTGRTDPHQFKVADSTWDVVNFGAGQDPDATIGIEKEMVDNGGNIFLEVPADETLEFKVRGPMQSPTVKVIKK